MNRTLQTLRREQAIVIGDAIRILVVTANADHVRLAIETPCGVDVSRDDFDNVRQGGPKRRDLLTWHPDVALVADRLADHFLCDAADVRVVGTGVAYFGDDRLLYARMCDFVQGLRCGAAIAAAGHQTTEPRLARRNNSQPL